MLLQVALQAGQVAGNELQALATVQLAIPADQVQLWQPAGRLAPGQQQALYDVTVAFKPATQQGRCKSSTGSSSSSSSSSVADSSVDTGGSGGDIDTASAASGEDDSCSGDCGASSVTRRIGFRTIELVRKPIQQTAAEIIPAPAAARSASSSGADPSAASSSLSADTQTGHLDAAAAAAAVPAAAAAAAAAASSAVTAAAAEAGSWAQVSGVWQLVRNISQSPVWWHPQPPPGRDWPLPVTFSYQPSVSTSVGDTFAGSFNGDEKFTRVTDSEDGGSSSQQQTQLAAAAAGDAAAASEVSEEGESFYFRVNGVPLYAKGANLIPLHVLSSAVSDDDVAGMLQSAAAANMNMVRIWGGGLYQVRLSLCSVMLCFFH
jgi:hypothetical protein